MALKLIHHPLFFEQKKLSLFNDFLNEKYLKKKVLILMDDNTEKFCYDLLMENFPKEIHREKVVIPNGEKNKSLENCIGLWSKLTELNFNRNDLIINLGGGMITDLGGFVASTYKRGMDYINIPTSLLAQVDASIGGKTGVNFEHYKNLIGSITLPKAVFIHDKFLSTLPSKQISSGFAEVIKSALIADEKLWNKLLAIEKLDVSIVKEFVKNTCEIKQSMVENDLNEKGIRKVLNFGHTVGHALESYSMQNHENPCFHGEAVAMGMIAESHISFSCGKITKNELDKIVSFIILHYENIPFELNVIQSLLDTMKKDKKNTSNGYNFTLLDAPGKACFDIIVEEKHIVSSLEYLHHMQF